MYFIRYENYVTWEYDFQGSSKWKKSIKHSMPDIFGEDDIHIIDAREPFKIKFMKSSSDSYPVPMLKSNIQKTFRQQKIDQCLSTTQQLLRQDAMECLRRIPIILLEDGLLHAESYSLIIWLMASHAKGYCLTEFDEEIVLHAVSISIQSSHRYSLKKEVDGNVQGHGFSIALRACFGGMKGDIAFLIRLAKRSNELEQAIECPTPQFPSFTIEQMVPESIDFHCCGSILNWCANKVPIEIQMIQNTIWWHWSSPNTRIVHEDESVHEYEKLERMKYLDSFIVLKDLLMTYSTQKIKWMYTEKKKVLVQQKISFEKK